MREVPLAAATVLESVVVTVLLPPARPQLKRPRRPVSEPDVRQIVGRFLSTCYDDLGIEPKKLDGQDMHGALGHVLPGKFKRGETLAEEVPDVLRAYLKHLEESEVLSNSFEIKQAFETTIDEFLQTVKTGSNPHGHGHHAPPRALHAPQRNG